MKRVGAALAIAALAAACADTGKDAAQTSTNERYLSEASFRRSTLVASLVAPSNGYSQLRLASYDSGNDDDWSRLGEWNPRVEVIAASELDAGVHASAVLGPGAHALAVPSGASIDDEALIALGREAFFHYPVQLERNAELAASSRASFESYGFWTDAEHGAGGLVRVEVADGTRELAYTCATCHAAAQNGALVIGVGNDRLDVGSLTYDAAARAKTPSDGAQRWLAWGPGRLDVTTTDGTEPVRIADVRPARWLTHLHADASVAQRDLASLAIRIETLIITSNGESVRPPRVVALALAAYLWSLADTLPAASALSPEAERGASLFATTCAACHAPPAFTGPPVPLAVVGTDPAIGLSKDRGTGMYRVPSLHGVATRRALLHDASLPSLASMFDPARVRSDFTAGRHGPGPVTGHPFGLALDDGDRAALLAYLATL